MKFEITLNGTKPIKDIHLNVETFSYFFNYVKTKLNFHTISEEQFNIAKYGLCNKAYILFNESSAETTKYRIICNYVIIGAFWYEVRHKNIILPKEVKNTFKELLKKTQIGHYDYILTQDISLKKPLSFTSSNIATNSRIWLKKTIESKLSKEEFQDIITKYGLPTRPQPLRKRSQDSTNIIKWNNCTEMDIHKAHASELLKIFQGTKVEPTIRRAIRQAFSKDKDVSKHWKDMLNMAVGNFALKSKIGSAKGKTIKWCYGLDTSPLYNRIVTDIRQKIEDQLKSIRSVNGCLVYAQTDGFIYQNAQKVKDNKDLGEFGVKSQGVVYTYHQPTIKGVSTGYTIYQVGDKVVGDLPDSLKKYIDLRVGKIVTYQKVVDIVGDNTYVSAKLLNIKKETINER